MTLKSTQLYTTYVVKSLSKNGNFWWHKNGKKIYKKKILNFQIRKIISKNNRKKSEFWFGLLSTLCWLNLKQLPSETKKKRKNEFVKIRLKNAYHYKNIQIPSQKMTYFLIEHSNPETQGFVEYIWSAPILYENFDFCQNFHF